MTPEQQQRAQEIISKQLEMSRKTLDALRNAGLTADREVEIDFVFEAPSETAARSLASHLETNDCLSLHCEKSGGFLSRKWVVTGKTYPTSITADVLEQWISWMVVQGVSRDCEFDGWGAEV